MRKNQSYNESAVSTNEALFNFLVEILREDTIKAKNEAVTSICLHTTYCLPYFYLGKAIPALEEAFNNIFRDAEMALLQKVDKVIFSSLPKHEKEAHFELHELFYNILYSLAYFGSRECANRTYEKFANSPFITGIIKGIFDCTLTDNYALFIAKCPIQPNSRINKEY
jgi:hypothetical protein